MGKWAVAQGLDQLDIQEVYPLWQSEEEGRQGGEKESISLSSCTICNSMVALETVTPYCHLAVSLSALVTLHRHSALPLQLSTATQNCGADL